MNGNSMAPLAWVLEASATKANDRMMLIVLGTHADRNGVNCWPALPTIRIEMAVSPNAVIGACKRLEASGDLVVARHPGKGGTGNPNHYGIVMGDVHASSRVRNDHAADWLRTRMALVDELAADIDAGVEYSFTPCPEHLRERVMTHIDELANRAEVARFDEARNEVSWVKCHDVPLNRAEVARFIDGNRAEYARLTARQPRASCARELEEQEIYLSSRADSARFESPTVENVDATNDGDARDDAHVDATTAPPPQLSLVQVRSVMTNDPRRPLNRPDVNAARTGGAGVVATA